MFVVPFKDCRIEQLHNTNLTGNHLGPQYSESFSECHKLCEAEAACVGFQTYSNYSACTLFTSISPNGTHNVPGFEAGICKKANC